MARLEERRARRYSVKWPVRVRSVGELEWQTGRVVDLSVSGVLFQLDNQYRVGAQVEVEIDFLTPDSSTVVSGVGVIVREHESLKNAAAVRFQIECGLSTRAGGAEPPGLRYPSARQTRAARSLE